MKKQKIVPFGIVFTFALLTVVANYIASLLCLVIPRYIFSSFTLSQTTLNIMAVFILAPMNLLTAWGLLFLYLRRCVPDMYEPSDDKNLCVKKTLSAVLPAEIIRFIICLTTLGTVNSTGRFGILPTMLFESVYLKSFQRYQAVRMESNAMFYDHFAFFVCYLIYFSVYIVGIIFIGKRLWKKADEEHKSSLHFYSSGN